MFIIKFEYNNMFYRASVIKKAESKTSPFSYFIYNLFPTIEGFPTIHSFALDNSTQEFYRAQDINPAIQQLILNAIEGYCEGIGIPFKY